MVRYREKWMHIISLASFKIKFSFHLFLRHPQDRSQSHHFTQQDYKIITKPRNSNSKVDENIWTSPDVLTLPLAGPVHALNTWLICMYTFHPGCMVE